MMCETAKESYPRYLAEQIAKRRRRKAHLAIQAYLCEFCKHWHIGGQHSGKKPKQFDRRRRTSVFYG